MEKVLHIQSDLKFHKDLSTGFKACDQDDGYQVCEHSTKCIPNSLVIHTQDTSFPSDETEAQRGCVTAQQDQDLNPALHMQLQFLGCSLVCFDANFSWGREKQDIR